MCVGVCAREASQVRCDVGGGSNAVVRSRPLFLAASEDLKNEMDGISDKMTVPSPRLGWG